MTHRDRSNTGPRRISRIRPSPLDDLAVLLRSQSDFELVRCLIEKVEAALEPGPQPGQFVLWADDVQQLGWARIVCGLAQGEELAECR